VPAGPERRIDPVQIEGEHTVLVQHRHLDDVAAEVTGHDQERHVGGRRQDHWRARAGVVRDRDLQRLDHVGDGTDPRRIDRPAEPALLELGAGQA
jgi:hypothetical protein